MMIGSGTVVKQIGAHGFYARVEVECRIPSANELPAVSVENSVADPWQRSQGWIAGALVGAQLGLKLAQRAATCTITQIHGMPCDTSPTLVAVAAIRAVWSTLGFEPDEALARRIESIIPRGFELSVADLEAEITGATRVVRGTIA